MKLDLILRGGMLVDGTGAEPRMADVGIADGRIFAVGHVTGPATREIDARGLLVTPGFVDIHTHYDGQALFSTALSPSSSHGVTTAVMGNCGVGFAPCKAADRERLIELMEGVEDIPGAVLSEGIDFRWEGFGEYLDALEARPHDIDFAAQLPHGSLRLHVMGERGARCEVATEEDCAQMAALAHQAMCDGALGFSTSRTLNHRTRRGDPTPSLRASEAELSSIALALRDAGRGVLQVVSDFGDLASEMDMLERVAARSGRPMSIAIAQHPRKPLGYRALLERISRARERGVAMRAQVCGRAVGLVLGLETSASPFSAYPRFRELARLPLAERCARLRDPELRASLEQAPPRESSFERSLRNWDTLFVLDSKFDYEPSPSMSIAAMARAAECTPAALALDALLADEGRGLLYLPLLNYAEGSLDACHEMLQHPCAMPGLSDGGAHVGLISDGSLPTFMLTHWTRDRRGERLTLPFAVEAQTSRTARAVGLFDRGVVAEGYKADLNVIDYQELALEPPHVVADLPAGGKRLMQRARGYVATIVSGTVIAEDGEPTSALPGRLVRGPQAAPPAQLRP